jgi:hypothetical protein
MSRSYKKNPYMYICNDSAKEDKQICNKMHRRKEKVNNRKIIVDPNIADNVVYEKPDELHNPWSWSTDGRAYYVENLDKVKTRLDNFNNKKIIK